GERKREGRTGVCQVDIRFIQQLEDPSVNSRIRHEWREGIGVSAARSIDVDRGAEVARLANDQMQLPGNHRLGKPANPLLLCVRHTDRRNRTEFVKRVNDEIRILDRGVWATPTRGPLSRV